LLVVSAAVFLGIAATLLLALEVVRRQPRERRNQLLRILAVAVALRLALLLILQLTGAWQITTRGAVAPDEAVIDYAARLMVHGDPRSAVTLGGSLHTAWLLVTASVYELWNNMLAVKLLNVVLGALLVVPSFLLGARLHSDRAGLMAAWAVALFPNAIAWSALSLREPLIVLVLMTIMLVGLSFGEQGRVLQLALFLGPCLLVLGFIRAFMFPLMIGLAAVAALVTSLRTRTLRPFAGAVLGSAIGLGLVLVMPHGPDLARSTIKLASAQGASIYNPFSDCSDGTSCTTDVGPSAGAFQEPGIVKPRAHTTSVLGGKGKKATSSLQSVREKGVVRAFGIAILGGRPVWRLDEFYFLFQPGVFVWWAILPLALTGLLSLAYRRKLAEFLVLGGFSGAVIMFLAFSGQFIRHHFMLEPVGVVLAVVGALTVLESRSVALRRTVMAATFAMTTAALVSVATSIGS
jgi:hypothetical protein